MEKLAYRKIWESVRKRVFVPEAAILLPEATVFHKYNRTVPTAQVRLQDIERNRYEIVYGNKAIDDLIESAYVGKTMREKKKEVLLMYIHYFYHESAHVLYTDMTMKAIKEITDLKLASYAAELNNILEDSYIQYRRMVKDHPHTKKIFLNGDAKLFRDSEMEKYKDDNDISSLYGYLLYSLRRGRHFKGENAFVNAHESEVNDWVSAFLNEHDSYKRAKVSVDFLNWILSTGEIVLPEASSSLGKEMLEGAWSSDKPKDKKVDVPPVVYETKPTDPEAVESKYEEDESEEGESKVDDDGEKDDTLFYEVEREDEDDESREDALEASVKDELKPDPYVESLDVLTLDHKFIDLCGYTSKWQEVESKDLEAINVISKATTKSIMVKLERDRARYIGGKDSGRLDVGAVISRSDGKVFKEKTKDLPIPKLAFSILMDNSGSISSTQTEVSTVASLSLAKACEDLEIPVEINAFTSDADGRWTKNTWVSWEIKTFDDTYKNSLNQVSKFLYKGYDHIEGHSMFGGNMEEVNIAHIASRFTKMHHDRHKVLIVLCDGATTGSTTKLKKVLETIGEDIYVIGIGLGVNLSHIYKRNFTLESVSEVNNLPLLMRDILKEFVFGEA